MAIRARLPWAGSAWGGVAPELPDWPEGPVPALGNAACAGADLDLFFPEPGEPDEEAKAICQGCPERAACLEAAVARDEEHGIWGGHNFEVPVRERKPAPWAEPVVRLSRSLPPMDMAELLGKLRAEHPALSAVARAAGISRRKARFYLDLLDLAPATAELVRNGVLPADDAVAAVRAARDGRKLGKAEGRRAS
jgi:hypothetical protein